MPRGPRSYVDITGNRYNRLTVLGTYGKDKHGNRLWSCRCDCGKTVNQPAYFLERGSVKSCGCFKRDVQISKTGNLIGKRFGLLTVTSMAGVLGPTGRARSKCLCRCDCGKEVFAWAAQLKLSTKGTSKGTTSCGCATKARRSASIMAINEAKFEASGGRTQGFMTLLGHYKQNAPNRGFNWGITEELFRSLTSALCTYCGCPPGRVAGKKYQHPYVYNGIDRVNNRIGYEPGNVVTCCSICNYMKRSMTVDEFLAHIKRIYEHSIAPQSSV